MSIPFAALRCVSQVALLGAVTPNLRGIALEYRNKNITLFFYYNHTPSDHELELAETVATEIIADFSESMIETEKITLPFPKKISIPSGQNGMFIYHRHEDAPKN